MQSHFANIIEKKFLNLELKYRGEKNWVELQTLPSINQKIC